jgi:hypothetical protein
MPSGVATTEFAVGLLKKLKLMLSAWAKQDSDNISATHPMDNANFLFMIVVPLIRAVSGDDTALSARSQAIGGPNMGQALPEPIT